MVLAPPTIALRKKIWADTLAGIRGGSAHLLRRNLAPIQMHSAHPTVREWRQSSLLAAHSDFVHIHPPLLFGEPNNGAWYIGKGRSICALYPTRLLEVAGTGRNGPHPFSSAFRLRRGDGDRAIRPGAGRDRWRGLRGSYSN